MQAQPIEYMTNLKNKYFVFQYVYCRFEPVSFFIFVYMLNIDSISSNAFRCFVA